MYSSAIIFTDLETITNLGIKFLKLYEEAYTVNEKFLSVTDENFKHTVDRRMIKNPKTVDGRLSSTIAYNYSDDVY